MLIRSQEFSYEVVQALPGEGAVLHYLCREAESQKERHLISMGNAEGLAEFVPFLAELGANAAFTDLKEFFLEEGGLWLVFDWEQGEPLEEYLEKPHSAGERFALGGQIMERLILLMMPPCLQWEVLDPGRMYVKKDGAPCFFYSFGNWKAFSSIDGPMSLGRLGDLLELLFVKEEESGLYPEWEAFLDRLEAGEWREALDIYKAYLELMPVFSEERKKEKKKSGFKDKFKKMLPRILTGVKIVMGLTVLVAAAVSAVTLWKGKVAPVVDAAAVWKATYVDGETLEPETEATSEAPTEEADPDNGRGERYREDGSLCYRGGLKDGLYDDTGTLYYPEGTVAYQGGFAFGKKEGEGSIYTDTGVLYYEGAFKKDLFEGAGKLYDGDTGKLVYEGNFSGGRYDGEGVIYDSETEFPLYVGNLRLGKYDGQGLEYDVSGSLLYEGEFLLGRHHGEGILYDPATGAVLLEGIFRNDNYMGPLEEKGGEEAGAEGAAEAAEDAAAGGAAGAAQGAGAGGAAGAAEGAGAGGPGEAAGETGAGGPGEAAGETEAGGPGEAAEGAEGPGEGAEAGGGAGSAEESAAEGTAGAVEGARAAEGTA